MGTHGGSPSEYVGDAQVVSNIDAPNTWKIYEAWYNQSLFSERVSLRFGLYDLNSEFDVIETAGLFLNSSHGIGADFSQTGLNGPSIFPTTSFGARFKIQPMQSLYLQTVILDAVSGDLECARGTHVNWNKNDGLLITSEIAYQTGADERYRKLAFGFGHYTSRFDNLCEVDETGAPLQTLSRPVMYALAEGQVFREEDDPQQGLAVFGRLGCADHRVNQFAAYTGAGVVYTGLLPGREEDQIGLAVAAAHNGDDFKEAQQLGAVAITPRETIFELTYRGQISPWLAAQPDLQYVINPSSDPSVKNALAVGARLEIIF
jgi:porin